jgi:hypothetical protein
MNVNEGSAAPRQFVAQPPFWGSKVASITTPAWQKNPGGSYLIMVVGIVAFSAVLGGLWMGVQSLAAGDSEWVQRTVGHGFRLVLVLLLFGGVYGWTWWSKRKKIVLSVSADGLTVNTRPGDVYSFTDAKLGTWGVTGGATMGTALHLLSGSHRFVLGGRDRRVAAGTRLEAPDAGYGQSIDVDAWLSAADFDEILAMVGRRSGLDVRAPAPDEPTRCLLFTNPLLIQEFGAFAVRKKQQFAASMSQPRLAIEVGPQTIRVVDPNCNTVVASVSPAHVTATPVTFRPRQRGHWIPNLGNAISDAATTYWSTTPGMRVTIPGMPPLTIGCRDSVSGLDFRFSWPDGVPNDAVRADYTVSGTDWLTLVEAFGLAPHLQTRGETTR